ncbi:MAG: hypothetical protein ABSG49_09720 [Methanoregula sp.]|jgi:hypothetical protein|uniref:hypothetical protein n=1 Tax=Methanoregula sp. TaxID=2052170 RepID=UPI003C20CF97
MKTKVLILVGILVIAFAAVVAPVMAATTGSATITGNPPMKMDLTLHGSITGWSLDPTASQPLTNSASVTMDVKSNDRSWDVSAKDALDNDGVPAAKTNAGFMLEYDPAGTGTWKTIALGNALHVGATTSGHLTGAEVTLSGSDQTIANGDGAAGGAGTFMGQPLTIKQTVAYSDPVLTGSEVYRIIVTLTGTTP